MSWSVKNGWHPSVGSFERKSDAQRLAAQMRAANKQAGIGGAVKVVRSGGGSSRKNPTKAQKRAAASRSRRRSGIAKAVKGLLKKMNPSAAITGARVARLKGGGLTIKPIKANRAKGWR